MSEEKKEKTTEELKYKEPTRWWVTLIMYLVEIAVATGLVFAILGARNFFSGEQFDQVTTYRYLADAFTIPGIVFIGLGLLVVLAGQGAFTGLGYIFRRMGRVLLPFLIRKDMTYAEYLESKKAKEKSLQFLSFLIVGVVFLAVSVVFIVLFYKIYQ